MTGYPELQNTVLDTTDVRRLDEFYRQLLGLRYLPGASALRRAGAPLTHCWSRCY